MYGRGRLMQACPCAARPELVLHATGSTHPHNRVHNAARSKPGVLQLEGPAEGAASAWPVVAGAYQCSACHAPRPAPPQPTHLASGCVREAEVLWGCLP